MKFSYLKFPSEPSHAFPDRKSCLRPVIPVTLFGSNNSLRVQSLIDSGADWCIFHGEIAKELGIDLKSGKQQHFFGVGGGKQFAYFHTVQMEIGGHKFSCYCAFSEDLKTPYSLLGQVGFFDKFQVRLDFTKEEIELKPKF